MRAGALVRVLRGVYGWPGPREPRWAADTHALLQRAAALHLVLTGEHWFSHTTAAVLWGCEVARVPGRVHVTSLVNPHARPRRDGAEVAWHWTSRAERVAEVSLATALPATSLERTAFDCAASLPPAQGLVVADSALRAGADAGVLRTLIEEAVGARGVRRAREVLELADGRAESAGESLTRWAVHDAGLPAPELQVGIETRLGWRWPDLGWPGQRLAVEFDGRVKYGPDRATAARAVFEEKRRQDALEDEGWMVVRVVWADLADLDALGDRLRRAYRRAARRAPRDASPR
ncbi:hypothetical protein [Cellulomonas sp. PS-H5]|uniref:hypothetical protein n=1 Tax=Cellulomonas sp. PS-H5 TaxID=2820400 RepID=UPI001C4E7BE4|nr:hypothetical protein [Cellulomonas sp. PS-H5]MBW0254173.1 hypothetical protein [Cellulomonas sp. PS-H5]